MSKLIEAVKRSNPNVKLGIAIGAGVVAGSICSMTILAYGNYREEKGRRAPARLVRIPQE